MLRSRKYCWLDVVLPISGLTGDLQPGMSKANKQEVVVRSLEFTFLHLGGQNLMFSDIHLAFKTTYEPFIGRMLNYIGLETAIMTC